MPSRQTENGRPANRPANRPAPRAGHRAGARGAPARAAAGLPSAAQVLDFIATADGPCGKREIARHFGLKGQERIALKALLKDMAEQGLIDGGKSAFHRMGGLPKVTVLRVIEIEDGEAIAIPESWQPDDGALPPRVRVRETGRRSALRRGDRFLARTEQGAEGEDASWLAFPMKTLPALDGALMGVIEFDASGKPWLAPVDKKVRNAARVVDQGNARAGQLVMAETVGRGARAGVKVIEVLGDPLAGRAFSLIAIHKHGIAHVFAAEALAEAEEAARLPLAADQREDLRHLPIIAIDPADARDHDDAIWAEPDGEGGFRALVAIADVSFYVRPGGALDREARKRGNSVYFPDQVVPMLPGILSAEVCSLKSGQDRAAMACHLEIAADGRVKSWRFARAIVRIQEVLAYEEAQARIDEGRAGTALAHLWDGWKALARERARRDPLDLDLPERRVVLHDDGQIAEIRVRERLDAHRVVEDFMIAANVAAAKALESRGSPVVYRIHERPPREKLVALREYFATLGMNLALGQVITPSVFNRMLRDAGAGGSAANGAAGGDRALVMEAVLRSQTQAYYGPRNAGHFGLALGSYAHFTSPIRRYSDLLVHRALVDAFGLEQPAPKGGKLASATGLAERDRADLAKICDAISMTERRAMEAERETIDRYLAAWLAGRVGEVFAARITGVQRFGFFATIVGLGGDGLVPISTLGGEYFHHDEAAQALTGEHSGTRFGIGDLLDLRLAEANPLTGALKFELPEGGGARVEPRGAMAGAQTGAGQGRRGGAGRDGKGAHPIGKRGRPANIRHQGRGRK